MKKAHHFSNILLAFAVLVGVSLACGSETPTSEPPKISTATSLSGVTQPPIVTQSPSDTPTATETPAVELYLGDTVQDNGYALTVLSVANPATPDEFYQAEAGKKLVAVEVIFTNVSGVPLGVNDLTATLLDNDGYVYETTTGAVNNQIDLWADLDPGEQVRGWIKFKIFENATPAKIKITETFGSTLLEASLMLPPEGYKRIALSLKPTIPSSKLGDVVEQSGYSLTAINVEDPTIPNRFYLPQQGYKMVAVEIILVNISGAESLSSAPYLTSLVDSNGFVYQNEVNYGRDSEIDIVDLSVGEKAKGWVSYVIPDSATPAYIKYELGLWSHRYLITGLAK